MHMGYARVSTEDQHLHLQIDALKQAGCGKIFTDELSGATSERPGLREALSFVRAGVTLVVWRLDWLGRTLKDLIERVEELKGREVQFRSLTENIDTSSSRARSYSMFSRPAQDHADREDQAGRQPDERLERISAGDLSQPERLAHNSISLHRLQWGSTPGGVRAGSQSWFVYGNHS